MPEQLNASKRKGFLEQERVPFIETMREQHLPMMKRTVFNLEQAIASAPIQNEKLETARQHLDKARRKLDEATAAHLPSDFLSRHREATQSLADGSVALSEGMGLNAEQFKQMQRYAAWTAVASFTIVALVATRSYWGPRAAALFSAGGTVSLNPPQVDSFKKLADKLEYIKTLLPKLSRETAAWQRLNNTSSQFFTHLQEVSQRAVASQQFVKADAPKIAANANRVLLTGENVIKEEMALKNDPITVRIFLDTVERVKYEAIQIAAAR